MRNLCEVAAEQATYEACGSEGIEQTKDILLDRMRRLGGDQQTKCCTAAGIHARPIVHPTLGISCKAPAPIEIMQCFVSCIPLLGRTLILAPPPFAPLPA